MNNAGPVAPHKTLSQYYGEESGRAGYVRELFDSAAPHYEWIDRVMSVGSGQVYRRNALVGAGLKPGMHVLDIAAGTGLVARGVLSVVGVEGSVVGLDPSAGMLRECVKALKIPVIQARGEALPCAQARFDFVSLGYGLRHVADLPSLFGECCRVLKPGGRLVILEFCRPRSRAKLWLWRFYLGTVVPALTRLGTGNRSAEQVMRYCWDTVDQSISQELVLGAMAHAGLVAGACRTVGGIFAEYSATKPL